MMPGRFRAILPGMTGSDETLDHRGIGIDLFNRTGVPRVAARARTTWPAASGRCRGSTRCWGVRNQPATTPGGAWRSAGLTVSAIGIWPTPTRHWHVRPAWPAIRRRRVPGSRRLVGLLRTLPRTRTVTRCSPTSPPSRGRAGSRRLSPPSMAQVTCFRGSLRRRPWLHKVPVLDATVGNRQQTTLSVAVEHGRCGRFDSSRRHLSRCDAPATGERLDDQGDRVSPSELRQATRDRRSQPTVGYSTRWNSIR